MLWGTKAVAQAKQGQWLNWEGVEKKKLSWKELWSMERIIRFLIGATYDVLSTPQNLKLWVNGDPLCLGMLWIWIRTSNSSWGASRGST